MSDNRKLCAENGKQNVGNESKGGANKRNSGLFSFFKWLKSSRESLNSNDKGNNSSSCDSLNSIQSTGTVASFSFVEPSVYTKNFSQKNIQQNPETDTYKARLKQRDRRREKDKNLTLRKKYNLFFNRDTLKTEENSKSLPLMTKPTMKDEAKDENFHRRTNSDSSKIKKAGAYLHVKGKRKAPQPPQFEDTSSASLRRRKKTAPPPPEEKSQLLQKIKSNLTPPVYRKNPKNSSEQEETKTQTENDEKIEENSASSSKIPPEIISNDSLKLDHGILKPIKIDEQNIYSECSPFAANSSESQKPWYKRHETSAQAKREFFKIRHEHKYEPVEKLPEVSFNRNSTIKDKKIDEKKNDKRKSGVSLLANISELDREAAEILKKEKMSEMPEFMKIKSEKIEETPKRRSARDLIAKFNAITNVTKVTVNSAFFGTNKDVKKQYFAQKKQQETLLESHKKRIELIDKKLNSAKNLNSLMKSESASVVKKPETPKTDRKCWNCPKCRAENEYWRIICHVCSTIKPYFDDLTTKNEKKMESPEKIVDAQNQYERILERSKTQIGFSALADYKNKENASNFDKKEEKERLKKMLIEMKNSLPKKAAISRKLPNRSSIIIEKTDKNETSDESSDSDNEDVKNLEENAKQEIKEEKTASILITTKETIYENIKVRQNSESKPIKVSSSVQTFSSKPPEPLKRANVTGMVKKKNSFEPMKLEDFEDIYSDRDGKTVARIYANLAQNDELSLFFNMPKNLNEMKNTLSKMKLQNRNKDTIEINRLLRRLEVAIAKGDLTQAADFAKELAQLKVNCSVIRQKSSSEDEDSEKDGISVDMYVEDKISHRGPFPLQVKPEQTVGELKKQVEKEFEIPINVQRWILGKELVIDDETTLKNNNITNGCPIFLYLVAPDGLKNDKNEKPSTSKEKTSKLYPNLNVIENEEKPKIIEAIPKIPPKIDFKEIVTQTVTTIQHLAQPENVEEFDTLKPSKEEWECHLCTLLNPMKSNICGVCNTVRQNPPKKIERRKVILKMNAPPATSSGETYKELMNLDNEDLVHNAENFECIICFGEVEKNEGVTLRECLHQFCKECLRHNIEFCDEAEVKCPYRDAEYSCNIALQDREIKALVSKEIYDQHLAKSVAQAENKMDKSFHCKTPDCRGWCIFEDNVNEFKCPVCKRTNCLTCQAIHMGLNCKQYQERMTLESESDESARQTRKMLDEMVEKGEALKCPQCQVIMMKKWGCDWLRCSVCKTEICWVTRGPRWGPGGKGDLSGGCQCGVNGIKCHPKCNYCH